jgi:predicted HTH domain antitoxin
MMKELTLEIPEEVLISLKEDSQEFSKDILMLAAVKLYEMGKLSSGRAASLAGVPRVNFLQSLSRYNVSVFDLSEEDLKHDLNNA